MRAALVAIALAAIAAPGATRDRNQVPEATPIGKPENCIHTIDIEQTQVRSDSVIDFEMRDRRIYRNVLPYACSGLGFERRILYKTSIGELCSVDTITVLYDSPIGPGATCGLGSFQPVQLAKR